MTTTPKQLSILLAMSLSLVLSLFLQETSSASDPDSSKVEFVMRSRHDGNPGEASCAVKHEKVTLDMKETAIVIVDMWTSHWCKRMTAAGLEMAPRVNAYITEARKRGATIIHCPSGGTGPYRDHQATANVKAVPMLKVAENGHRLRGWNRQLDSEPYTMMIDRTPLGGCACEPRCRQKMDLRQIEVIKVHDEDYVTQSGHKLLGLLTKKKIRNVLYTGAAIERCVLGRPFGARHMTAAGFNVHLVRDLTDGMHLYPWIKEMSHAQSNQISFEHVERFISPTVISASLLDNAKQEELSKNAIDNKPSMRLVPVWEKKPVEGGEGIEEIQGVDAIKLYSKLGTNIYEAVVEIREPVVGEHKYDLTKVFQDDTLKLDVKDVQVLVSGSPSKVTWSKPLKHLG